MSSRSGAVHVATATRHCKGKTYTTHLLRRSLRVGRQVKHETLGNLSHLPDSLIDIIRRSLAGERFVPAAQTFLVERSLPRGHVEAVLGALRRVGLERLLGAKRSRQRDLVVALIVERLLDLCSKLATTRLWHHSTLAQQLQLEQAEGPSVRTLDENRRRPLVGVGARAGSRAGVRSWEVHTPKPIGSSIGASRR